MQAFHYSWVVFYRLSHILFEVLGLFFNGIFLIYFHESLRVGFHYNNLGFIRVFQAMTVIIRDNKNYKVTEEQLKVSLFGVQLDLSKFIWEYTWVTLMAMGLLEIYFCVFFDSSSFVIDMCVLLK